MATLYEGRSGSVERPTTATVLTRWSRALISPGLGFWNAKGFPLVDVGAAPAYGPPFASSGECHEEPSFARLGPVCRVVRRLQDRRGADRREERHRPGPDRQGRGSRWKNDSLWRPAERQGNWAQAA